VSLWAFLMDSVKLIFDIMCENLNVGKVYSLNIDTCVDSLHDTLVLEKLK